MLQEKKLSYYLLKTRMVKGLMIVLLYSRDIRNLMPGD